MKINKKLVKMTGLLFILCMCFNVSAGNGSGNEPPKDKMEKASLLVCEYFGFMCTRSLGNGSGNEPPR